MPAAQPSPAPGSDRRTTSANKRHHEMPQIARGRPQSPPPPPRPTHFSRQETEEAMRAAQRIGRHLMEEIILARMVASAARDLLERPSDAVLANLSGALAALETYYVNTTEAR